MSNLIVNSQNKLYIINNKALEFKDYIQFKDPEVRRICVETWGDGNGLEKSQAAAVTSIRTWFQNNTTVTEFNEFKYFTGLVAVGSVGSRGLSGMTNLREITLPSNMPTINIANLFINDSSLETLTFYGTFPSYASNAQQWVGCSSLQRIYCHNFEQWCSILPTINNGLNFYSASNPFGSSTLEHYIYFDEVEVRELVIPNTVTLIKAGACYRWNRLTSVTIPSSVTSIGASAFQGCSGLTNVIIPASVVSPSTGPFSEAGDGLGSLVYIGDTLVQMDGKPNFDSVIISGDAKINNAAAGNRICSKKTYIYGDFTLNGTAGIIGNFSVTKFLSFGGIIQQQTAGTGRMIYSSANWAGQILHFGYSGIATTPSIVNIASNSKVLIYVGDGSSAAHDDAILAQYLADTDWSAYSAKLDTWYNYVQGGGEYATSPTIPTK